MSEFILAVFFLINGQWIALSDFPPVHQPDMATCELRMQNAQAFFDQMTTERGLPEADVGCFRDTGEVY